MPTNVTECDTVAGPSCAPPERRIACPKPSDDPSSAPSAVSETGQTLRKFLQAYWLRPENALWMTLRSLTLSTAPFRRPAIDVSCGDGVFSFLHFGGALDPAFDVFTSVCALNRRPGDPTDMFDYVADDYRPPIESRPKEKIDVGTDCKATMLAKAERLRFYDRLVEHDNNRPLPFDDGTFATVYCNAAYWVENINGFVAELRRITASSGRIILHVKLDAMRDYTLDRYEDVLGSRFLEILGRNRFDCWPTLTDRATWESRFASAGLTIEQSRPFVTRTHAHLWDVGLRPIAPLLIRMANALTPATRAQIKRDWVALLEELLTPLADPMLNLFGNHAEAAEVQYVLGRGT